MIYSKVHRYLFLKKQTFCNAGDRAGGRRAAGMSERANVENGLSIKEITAKWNNIKKNL